ncbi:MULTISPECIES: hypothetical protein [unclassified Saccharopolyspora]|uniref:hypothetical protein n=1 Tax=unclassified Saccharopolyspora TaxID=2646250 RepID=UPI001CD41C44|nr:MULTISPECIES: hypothetical protein [unclassified Saccharopolyspora]MCA1185257.1 hypothetical protein [Saccharopolyspora sp. 6T]MCA1280959.1 hypothetical protein [Saccharopolyspora sp. 7B]
MSEPEVEPVRVRDLIVRPQGSTVLILHSSGGDETEQRVFGAVPVAPGDGLVLAAAEAVRASGFRAALRHASRTAVTTAAARAKDAGTGPPRLWLAISGAGRLDGRGRSTAQKLAREFAVEVYAPDGPVTFVAGGSIFTGADHHGWVRFPAGGGAGELHSARYPQPPWEALLPRGAVHDGGLHAEPVPAGLAASATAETTADEVWHAVAVSAEHPRIVLGGPQGPAIAPHQVAALLRRFPHAVRERIQLVPAHPEPASPQWLGKLAALLGHDVVSATGLIRHGVHAEFTLVPDQRGGPSWLPLAALLRYSPDGRVEPVLAGAPPRGWVPAGPLVFRWGGMTDPHPTPHEVIAKVVPAGVALLPAPRAGVPGAADRLTFEPDRLTVVLGWPCTPLPEGMPAALNRLLSGLDAEQRVRARLLVQGIASESMREQLRGAAGPLADRLRFPAVLPAAAGLGDPVPDEPVSGGAVSGGAVSPGVVSVDPASAGPASPGAASGRPVSGGPASGGPVPGGPVPGGPVPVAASDEPVAPAAEDAPAAETPQDSADGPSAASTAPPAGTAPAGPNGAAPGGADGPPTGSAAAAPSTSDGPGTEDESPAPMTSLATRRIPLTGLLPADAGFPVAVRADSAQDVPRMSAEVPMTQLAAPAALPKRQPGASPLSLQSRQRKARLSAAAAKRAERPEPVRVTQLATISAAQVQPPEPNAAAEPAVAPADRTMRLSVAALRLPPRRTASGERSALVPIPALPQFLAERRSSDQQRTAFAQRAGTDFEAGLAQVRAALAAATDVVEPEPEADLVAVRLYLGDGAFGAVSVNRALRGAGRDEFGDHAVCLMSGLRRLPVHGGPVHRLLELDALDVYEPGMPVSEAGFLSAGTEPVRAEGHAQVMLWSQDARRTTPLGDTTGEVVFPAGARFAVLAVDRDADGPVVLLRELGRAEEPGEAPDSDAEHLELMRLARKHRRAAARTPAGDALARLAEPVGFVPDELPEPAER